MPVTVPRKKELPPDVSVKLCNYGTPMRESGPTQTPHILAIFPSGIDSSVRTEPRITEKRHGDCEHEVVPGRDSGRLETAFRDHHLFRCRKHCGEEPIPA